jgi:exodeoxyribonuclease VII small subunit
MATSTAGEFEDGLKRLEEIVAKLERENVSLDESVALFREGKALAQKCELLLKSAQSSIEAAARGDAPAGAVAPAGAPVASVSPVVAAATAARSSRGTTSLFGSDIASDADPDL